jgi:hypothetical protein
MKKIISQLYLFFNINRLPKEVRIATLQEALHMYEDSPESALRGETPREREMTGEKLDEAPEIVILAGLVAMLIAPFDEKERYTDEEFSRLLVDIANDIAVNIHKYFPEFYIQKPDEIPKDNKIPNKWWGPRNSRGRIHAFERAIERIS